MRKPPKRSTATNSKLSAAASANGSLAETVKIPQTINRSEITETVGDYLAAYQRAQTIQLILMDCDGVLTDGRIILLPDGEEIKHFHVLDGQGVTLAHQAGLRIGVISGRRSKVLERRAQENRFDFLVQQAGDKRAALEQIINETNLAPEQIAFIGDDLPDIAPMRRAGLAIAVASAVAEVKAIAQLITSRNGGNGAVREAIEFILRAQQRWPQLLAHYDVSD